MGVPALALETCAQPLRLAISPASTANNQKGLEAKIFMMIISSSQN
jgi:hypothetical protein